MKNPSKLAIAEQFNRQSQHYDQAADLQRQSATVLLHTLLPADFKAQTILDVGAGTGYCAQVLRDKFQGSHVIALDIASNMLCYGRSLHAPSIHWCAADFDYLPLKEKSIDLVVANMSLQWSLDLPNTLASIRRILAPQGLFIFSLPGVETLKELRECWRRLDEKRHVNDFFSVSQFEKILQTEFTACNLSELMYKRKYPSVLALFKELKMLGANYVVNHQRKGLGGKKILQDLIACYPAENQQINASFHIIYGSAQ